MKIAFRNVFKNYGSFSALKDISFDINEGEFVILVGPSGAGKSTILKLILQQINPSGGNIELDGVVVTGSKTKNADALRRSTGVVFQDYQLIPTKTLYENIALALDINNIPATEHDNRIDIVLSRTGLSNKKGAFPSQLSGGELQRGSLARALSVGPRLLLADEPTGNLDPENTQKLIDILKEINKTGTTILMTTHNMELISSLKTRILVLNDGNLHEKEQVIKSKKKHS